MAGYLGGGAGLVPAINPADYAFMAGDVQPFNGLSVLDTGSLVPSGTPQSNVFGGFQAPPNSGLGALGIANLALGGLQSLGSLWMSNKALKLAKKQFKLTKDMSISNLNNQMQSYNTALADRARSRGVMEGQTQGQVQQYIDSNSLTRDKGRSGYSVGDVSSAALSNYNDYLARGTGGSSSGSSTGSGSSRNDDDNTRG